MTPLPWLIGTIALPLNFEMAATEEMVAFAERIRPPYCCLVPEKREELTTEGGLDVIGGFHLIAPAVARLKDQGMRISLFIDPDMDQIEAALKCGADAIELHTGRYAHAVGSAVDLELSRIRKSISSVFCSRFFQACAALVAVVTSCSRDVKMAEVIH